MNIAKVSKLTAFSSTVCVIYFYVLVELREGVFQSKDLNVLQEAQ